MPWLTPVVFKQGADEPLTRVPLFGDGPSRVRFRHIVHSYRDHVNPDNTAVQSITFDTIRGAQQYALPDTQATLVLVTFPEDSALVPATAVAALPLARAVGDIARFAAARHLPLLFDILTNGIEAVIPRDTLAKAHEYVVLTNSDIHLQPPFYRVLAELIREGYDVITVNRRTIDVDLGNRSFSPLFMADEGTRHGGFDCFVFPLPMFSQFIASRSCCGAGYAMRSLLFNLVAHARRFLMLTTPHMTFHLGNDKPWSNSAFADYGRFNFEEALTTLVALAADSDKAKRLVDFVNVHESKEFCDALPNVLSRAMIAGGGFRA